MRLLLRLFLKHGYGRENFLFFGTEVGGGRIVGRQGEGQCQWRGSLCVLLAVAAPLRSGGHTPGSLDDSFV